MRRRVNDLTTRFSHAPSCVNEVPVCNVILLELQGQREYDPLYIDRFGT
jgi:hypothetical protein